MSPQKFNSVLYDTAKELYRDMPWRTSEPDGSFDGYKVLVSEFMLQQTQVGRVVPKYEYFLSKFPTISSLATASLAEVLVAWSGLGYNRRAKYLHESAKILQHKSQPWSYEDLVSCIGIGPNTAKAVRAYAYDLPEVFIETNIRTVYIHYFFADHTTVTDKQITALVEDTINKQSPRTWYWALMDSGARLKTEKKGGLVKSAAYKKQPVFHGSLRQIRGLVLKTLAVNPRTAEQLVSDDDRTKKVLASLVSEGLISKKGNFYYLGS